MTKEEMIELLRTDVEEWNRRRDIGEVPEKPDLYGADLIDASLIAADLRGSSLSVARLCDACLSDATLIDAILREADLRRADLSGADLRGATFCDASLIWADLRGADLRGADLSGANLSGADLSGADLRGTDLSGATLVKVQLKGCDLTGARIYGISAWDVERDEHTKQSNLVITNHDEPAVTVDDLEVAQFVYLLLKHKRIRQVIDTITSKAVLILGRFSDERKAVLDAVHEHLREDYGLVPIMFDWDPSESRDLTETVVTLAGMSRFIVADLTDAKSIPQELSHIIPTFQSVPIRPLILGTQRPFAMHEHWERFNNVLPILEYNDEAHLIGNLKTEVIDPIEAWEQAVDKGAAKKREAAEQLRRKDAELIELRAELEAFKRQHATTTPDAQ